MTKFLIEQRRVNVNIQGPPVHVYNIGFCDIQKDFS